jgi:hypothetical protein
LARTKFVLGFGPAVGGAFHKAWDMPCAPTRATRDVLAVAAETPAGSVASAKIAARFCRLLGSGRVRPPSSAAFVPSTLAWLWANIFLREPELKAIILADDELNSRIDTIMPPGSEGTRKAVVAFEIQWDTGKVFFI